MKGVEIIMITKAVIKSINKNGNRCIVRMPLFENASNPSPVEAEALVSITPGLFNNLFVGDVVFVAFEENALEKPIILGKLFKGISDENQTAGGAGILDSLKVHKSAAIPSSTLFVYPSEMQKDYKNLKTPKMTADYIKWLEKLTKKFADHLDSSFRCFKNWTQWQLKAENVEIDDGDLDNPKYQAAKAFQYQEENEECRLCGSACIKNKKRQYLKLETEKEYPKI